jgi:hypothetical protein
MRVMAVLLPLCMAMQDRPATTQAARPQRTEADARERADANRRGREEQRIKSGAAPELVSDYVKANIGPVPTSLGLNPFYKKYTDAMGIPVVSSEGEHIFVHEFSHAMMTGIRDIDPAMHAEIRAAYDKAMAAGKYTYDDGRKHYATTNASEYWAEGVQWWFFSNYGECFAGKVKVETPEEFAAYDPVLNELIGRVYSTHRIPMDVFHARRVRPVTC